jgi:hypothetical protein
MVSASKECASKELTKALLLLCCCEGDNASSPRLRAFQLQVYALTSAKALTCVRPRGCSRGQPHPRRRSRRHEYSCTPFVDSSHPRDIISKLVFDFKHQWPSPSVCKSGGHSKRGAPVTKYATSNWGKLVSLKRPPLRPRGPRRLCTCCSINQGRMEGV